ncbi:membrane hypothetical protein [Hyella patelloides LEGE 07179]|uniref:Uncharacterized protein n=1 Tax=Hyella patelloides LEGE 07179 TaxID=945734 RepID=A0A563VV78_9CYAN|nr:hypothetical protein [Hyella patelloides]VEP15311.1 membrane hypothetical protein [Hyella patelloides LEGE 07179]
MSWWDYLFDNVPINWSNFNCDKTPIFTSALCGLLIATGFLFAALGFSSMLVWREKRTGGVGAAGGVIGFIIVPAVMFTGAPWSLWIDNDYPDRLVPAIIGGNLLNGILIGTLLGSIKKFLL